jgi:hypothetical protein
VAERVTGKLLEALREPFVIDPLSPGQPVGRAAQGDRRA